MDQFQTPWYLAWNEPVSDTVVSSVEWAIFRHRGL